MDCWFLGCLMPTNIKVSPTLPTRPLKCRRYPVKHHANNPPIYEPTRLATHGNQFLIKWPSMNYKRMQWTFLAHLSWKLKWAFLITCRPSSVCLSVCLSVCPSVCKPFTFSSSSPEPLGQFQPNLAQNILGWRGFKFFKWRAPLFSKGR